MIDLGKAKIFDLLTKSNSSDHEPPMDYPADYAYYDVDHDYITISIRITLVIFIPTLIMGVIFSFATMLQAYQESYRLVII